eukprot:3406969-Amphidinium_carterae.1
METCCAKDAVVLPTHGSVAGIEESPDCMAHHNASTGPTASFSDNARYKPDSAEQRPTSIKALHMCPSTHAPRTRTLESCEHQAGPGAKPRGTHLDLMGVHALTRPVRGILVKRHYMTVQAKEWPSH